MRLLAFADEPPPADAAELVGANEPQLVVTLGDLKADWIASLAQRTCRSSACMATMTRPTS